MIPVKPADEPDTFDELVRQPGLRALPDLMARYNNLCAYTALYIEDGTGDPTVDHFTPVSSDWHNAYEWSNYRLACGQANTNKGLNRSLDPFDIKDDWFELPLNYLERRAPFIARELRRHGKLHPADQLPPVPA